MHRVTDGNLGAAATVIEASTQALLGITATDVTDLVEFVDKSKSTVVV